MFHVGTLAVYTLLINAPTTGRLVKYLGLTDKTEVQKQLLHSVTTQLDKSVDGNIEDLKSKRYFNQVEWSKVKEVVDLAEFKKKNAID
jgi:hypothetical protein